MYSNYLFIYFTQIYELLRLYSAQAVEYCHRISELSLEGRFEH